MFNKFKESSAKMKYCVIMPVVLSFFYFIAATDLDYGYYVFIRILSLVFLGIFIFVYYAETDSFLNFPNIASMIVLILFNPVISIYLDKSMWIVFDMLSGITMCFIAIYVIVKHLLEESHPSENKHLDFMKKYSKTKEDTQIKNDAITIQLLDLNVRNILNIIEKNVYNSSLSLGSEIEFSDENTGFGVIKQNPIARLDYSIYIFFNIYCSLGHTKNEKFVRKFGDMYERILKEYFSQEIDDEALVNEIFDNRLISYDKIMMTSEDKDGDLIYIISQFISNDLWANDPLSKKIFIAPYTKALPLNLEINLLYRNIFQEIKPYYMNLNDISKSFVTTI